MSTRFWFTDCEQHGDFLRWYVLRSVPGKHYSVEYVRRANGQRQTYPSEHTAELAAADLNKSLSA